LKTPAFIYISAFAYSKTIILELIVISIRVHVSHSLSSLVMCYLQRMKHARYMILIFIATLPVEFNVSLNKVKLKMLKLNATNSHSLSSNIFLKYSDTEDHCNA
jgi:hypothetical protein